VVRLRHGGLSPSAVRNVQVFDGQGIRLQLTGVTDGFHEWAFPLVAEYKGRTASIRMKKPPVSSRLIQSAFGMSYARTLHRFPPQKQFTIALF
jgi:hypothetical protein